MRLLSSIVIIIVLVAPVLVLPETATAQCPPICGDPGTVSAPAATPAASPPGTVSAPAATPPGTVTEPVRTPSADTGSNPTYVTIESPLRAQSIQALFIDLINVVLVFATPIIVFFIIYAGFLYVTARGDTGQVGKATNALLYAVIGGVLILGAFVILRIIEGTVRSITI